MSFSFRQTATWRKCSCNFALVSLSKTFLIFAPENKLAPKKYNHAILFISSTTLGAAI